MKKLFVIGDSTSINYGPYLKGMLKGLFRYSRKGDPGTGDPDQDPNARDSGRVLEYLKSHPGLFSKYDCILLNCGLHDLKIRAPGTKRLNPPAQYRKNLVDIIHFFGERKIPLVWMRNTHIDDRLHNRKSPVFKRYNRDVIRYNTIADKVMAAGKIPVIDLYSFTRGIGGNPFADHAHFTRRFRQLQAAFIAGHLESLQLSL